MHTGTIACIRLHYAGLNIIYIIPIPCIITILVDAPLKMWILLTIQKVITILSATLRSNVLLIRYNGKTSVITSVIFYPDNNILFSYPLTCYLPTMNY